MSENLTHIIDIPGIKAAIQADPFHTIRMRMPCRLLEEGRCTTLLKSGIPAQCDECEANLRTHRYVLGEIPTAGHPQVQKYGDIRGHGSYEIIEAGMTETEGIKLAMTTYGTDSYPGVNQGDMVIYLEKVTFRKIAPLFREDIK